MPVNLRAIAGEHHDCRGGYYFKPVKDFIPLLIASIGAEDDEIGIQEFLKLGIFKKLLTQQSTGPSATRVKIDENQLFFTLRFGQGLIESSLKPDLSESRGGE